MKIISSAFNTFLCVITVLVLFYFFIKEKSIDTIDTKDTDFTFDFSKVLELETKVNEMLNELNKHTTESSRMHNVFTNDLAKLSESLGVVENVVKSELEESDYTSRIDELFRDIEKFSGIFEKVKENQKENTKLNEEILKVVGSQKELDERVGMLDGRVSESILTMSGLSEGVLKISENIKKIVGNMEKMSEKILEDVDVSVKGIKSEVGEVDRRIGEVVERVDERLRRVEELVKKEVKKEEVKIEEGSGDDVIVNNDETNEF